MRYFRFHLCVVFSVLIALAGTATAGGNWAAKNFNMPLVMAVSSDSCDNQMPGDLDGDGDAGDLNDLLRLVDFLCNYGPLDVPLANADVTGDCAVNFLDYWCLYGYWPFACGPVECTCVEPVVGPCYDTCEAQYLGDLNNSGEIDISDLIHLVDFVFKGGPRANPPSNADVDGSCQVNVADITYLVAYMFEEGPEPPECTCVFPEYSGSPTVAEIEALRKNDIIRELFGHLLPNNMSLEQNKPNPFNPTTEINFNLSAESKVILEVYNTTGQRVVTLIEGTLEAGRHSVIWDGKDDNGTSVASGIYLYKIEAGDLSESRKMVLLK